MGWFTDFFHKHRHPKRTAVIQLDTTDQPEKISTPIVIIKCLRKAPVQIVTQPQLPGATTPNRIISKACANSLEEFKPSSSEARAIAAMIAEKDAEDTASETTLSSDASSISSRPAHSQIWKCEVMVARSNLEHTRSNIKRLMKRYGLTGSTWQKRLFNFEEDDVTVIRRSLIKAGANASIVDNSLATLSNHLAIFHQQREIEFAKLTKRY